MKRYLRSSRTTREADILLWRNDVPSEQRCRDLLMAKRVDLRQHLPPRLITMFDPERRRLMLGHDTQHRTPGARRWRLRLRLKQWTRRLP